MKTNAWPLLLAVGIASGGLTSCGDPIVDGDYRGEALFSLEGTVRVSPAPQTPAPLPTSALAATLGQVDVSNCVDDPDDRVALCAPVALDCEARFPDSLCNAVRAACLTPTEFSETATCDDAPFLGLSTDFGCTELVGACLNDGLYTEFCNELLIDCGVASVGVGTPAVEAAESNVTEVSPGGELRLAVFWSRHGLSTGTGLRAVDSVEQQAVTTSTFPARYELELFTPPPEDVVFPADGSGEYAVGLILVYVDENNDRVWNDDIDRLVGGAPDRALVYTPEGATSDFFGTLGAGFHRVRIPREDGHDPCTSKLHTELTTDLTDELHLQIDDEFHLAHLVDVNCDGHHAEWSVCARPEQLTFACLRPDAHPEHAWQCSFCPKATLEQVCPEPSDVDALCGGGATDEFCGECPRASTPFSTCKTDQQRCLLDGLAPDTCDWLRHLCDGADAADAVHVAFEGAPDACLSIFDTALFTDPQSFATWRNELQKCLTSFAGRPADFGSVTCTEVGQLCGASALDLDCEATVAACTTLSTL